MQRPYVQLEVNNEIDQLLTHLEAMLPRFQSFPGVMGITLNGGLSRGFADHLSEIDVTFYLDGSGYQTWSTGKAPIPSGIVKLDGMLYDIKLINYEEEDKRQYGEVELWDLSYGKILYDPDGKIRDLFEKKLSEEQEISKAFSLLWESYWNFRLAGDIWIHRGDVLQGHLMLNESIKPMIKALFIANRERIPHEKWLVHMSRTLQWKPGDLEEKLMRAMRAGDFSVEDLGKRQAAIEELNDEIDEYIKGKYYPGFTLKGHQKPFFDLLRDFVKKGSVLREDWEKAADLEDLNTDPLHMITEIQGDRILLNKEKLLSIEPKDLYSWHYEVVREVIKDLQLDESEE